MTKPYLTDFEVYEEDTQLIKFAKIELDHITNKIDNQSDKDIMLLMFSKSIVEAVVNISNSINDPIILNTLAAKMYNLRKYIDKGGISSPEVNQVIRANLDSTDSEIKLMGDVISYIQFLIIDDLEYDAFCGLSQDHIQVLSGLALQRIIYLISWIPLRTFKTLEELDMQVVGGSEANGKIYQSSIAGRVYVYDKFSDKPYIANAITFQRKTEDGFEAYVCDESRLFIKFPLKSSHFIPHMIRIDENEKVFKQDRAKYKKLKKRIVSSQPRFLQNQ